MKHVMIKKLCTSKTSKSTSPARADEESPPRYPGPAAAAQNATGGSGAPRRYIDSCKSVNNLYSETSVVPKRAPSVQPNPWSPRNGRCIKSRIQNRRALGLRATRKRCNKHRTQFHYNEENC